MLKRENRLSKITGRKGERKYFSPLFNIRISENKDAKARFGFVVSKKVSKLAVDRNKTKRLLRAAAGTFLDKLSGKDILVVAKTKLSGKDAENVLLEFKNIFEKL